MNAIVSALVGSGATGLIGWVIMAVRNKRREKGDRIGDLRLDVNQRFAENRDDMNKRFAEHREDMNRQFAEHREDMNRQFAEHREDMNRRFDEYRADLEKLRADLEKLRADTEKGFSAVLNEIKGLEHRLIEKFTVELKHLDTKFTGELKAQGERIDRIHDVLRDHAGRLARIEARLDKDPPAEAA